MEVYSILNLINFVDKIYKYIAATELLNLVWNIAAFLNKQQSRCTNV